MVSTRLNIPSLSSNVKPEFLPNLKDAMMQLGVFGQAATIVLACAGERGTIGTA